MSNAAHEAHVLNRHGLILSVCRQRLSDTGPDPEEWDLAELVTDLAAAGVTATGMQVLDVLLLVARSVTEEIRAGYAKGFTGWEIEDAEYLDEHLGALDRIFETVRSGREASLPYREHWARAWYRRQGLSAESRCRGCSGGSAPHCPACQAQTLGPALAASVAQVLAAARKVA